MSINLDIQNWPSAAASSPPPSAPTHQMMNKSANGVLPKFPDKANDDDDGLWNKTCCLKLLAKIEGEDEHGSSVIANMKSSLPVFSRKEHQMLSFSGSDKLLHLPNYFCNNSASHYNPNFTGYYRCGGAANKHDLINGPFTPSQWMELEHQALIYKHITSNMPVPPSLLTPIRRALSHAAFSRYNAGHFASLGWGGFHMGLQNNIDPEPGRCRRTDGKKWRCSRDAVADQKYCERHINRGRHRSRKPVEGQYHNIVGKPIPTSSVVVAGNIGSGLDCLISEKHKISLDKKKLHLGISGTAESGCSSRISLNKEMMTCDGRIRVDSHDLLAPASSVVLNPRDNIHNNRQRSCGLPFGSHDFGLVPSDALKNPQLRPNSTPTHQFMDDCPKNQPDQTSTMWPNLDDTQLSISVPMAHHVTDSPSSLTLAWELDSMPTGLELGGSKHTDQRPESEDKHANWIPDIRDSILGGPLGEVLQNSSGANNAEIKNTSPKLNLMTDVWDKGPRFTSSPNGVLHKEADFTSQANCGAGSSPRAETNMAATLYYL